MQLIGLAVVLALSVVLTPLAAEAQQGVRVEGQRVPRVGVACNNCVSHPKPDDPVGAFCKSSVASAMRSARLLSSTFVGRRAIVFPRSLLNLFERR